MPLSHFLKRLQFQQFADNSNEYLFDVINLLAEGIIVTDPKGVVIFCNKKAPKILHRTEQSIINQPMSELLKKAFVPKTKLYSVTAPPSAHKQPFGHFFEKHILQQRKALIEQDIVYQGRHQEYVLATNIRPVFDEDNELEVVIVSFRDVTKRRENQENQVRFARIMGHELKHPLASIKAYIHFLRKLSAPGNARIHSYLDKTDQQVNILVKMINDLLDISKISANRLAITLQVKNVSELVVTTVNDLKPVHRSHTLKCKSEAGLLAEIDEMRVRQVITNLVSNAVKYSPEGEEINVTVSAKNNRVLISVSDKGPGIDEKKLKRIFEPYQRVISKDNRHVKGLGLGLYIARSIIDKHGGKIYATNNPEGGSKFTIELPLVKE
ncbi:MAG TPA: PAS domain-containing sensor histidine kinase [Patescibacteria group bacterium]